MSFVAELMHIFIDYLSKTLNIFPQVSLSHSVHVQSIPEPEPEPTVQFTVQKYLELLMDVTLDVYHAVQG